MPIEQSVGSPTNEDNESLRQKIGDITLDSDQVWKKLNNFINRGITLKYHDKMYYNTGNLIFKRFDFT